MKLIAVITGTHSGIGNAAAKCFLTRLNSTEFELHGIDIQPADDLSADYTNYHHHIADVGDFNSLPDIHDVSILINNAGVQNSGHDIQTNLVGTINCTKKYALQTTIRSVLNLASVSAHNGAEFDEYTASKGGVLSYTRWAAKQLAKYGATCNSISFGGVYTDLNRCVIEDVGLWKAIMDQTPLKKWVTPEEAADWIYFLTVLNKSCSGQDIIVDNLEMLNHTFVWET